MSIEFNSELTAALRIWSGFEDYAWPNRDDERLTARLGNEAAAKLLPQIKELSDAFYESTAWQTAADIADMARIASADFRERYPEAPDEVVNTLAACYTYDYK